MATLAAGVIVEIQSGATAGNVNGGMFNPNNANFMTDLTTNSNTANTAAPVVSSATYNFDANDVGHWLYISAGTNWTVGWYKIQSVATNKATLEAAVGSANVRQVVNNQFGANTVIGCATVGTPTSGTFTIDYSQGPAAIQGFANLGSASGSTTLTDNSSAGLMKKTFAGNHICLSAGTNATVGWYEIVSVTNTNSVVLNVTPHGANTMSSTTGKVGGAISLGGSTSGITDNNIFVLGFIGSGTACPRYFIQGGSSITYTLGVAVSPTGSSLVAWPQVIEGYATGRGDRPQGATRPTLACGANIFNSGSCHLFDFKATGTGTSVIINAGGGSTSGCKATNSSTTAGRSAMNANSALIQNCELISYRGTGIGIDTQIGSGPVQLINNYIHDSDKGFSTAAQSCSFISLMGNIFEGCVTSAIDFTTQSNVSLNIFQNTIYGAENKLGNGILTPTGISSGLRVFNNIFYGLATGLSIFDVQASGQGDYNDFFNNTNDINTANHWQKGVNDIAVNPSFTSVGQVTGATATTTAGNHIVQTGATFVTSGVVAGQDYVYVKSGTGVTAGIYGIASVDSETQITTDIAITANATADKVFQITTGHNFLPAGSI